MQDISCSEDLRGEAVEVRRDDSDGSISVSLCFAPKGSAMSTTCSHYCHAGGCDGSPRSTASFIMTGGPGRCTAICRWMPTEFSPKCYATY